MPYDKSNVPDKIKGLPEHAQDVWMSAFNSAWEQYKGDEEKCNATAWAAVKKAGYDKNEKGEWVKMQFLNGIWLKMGEEESWEISAPLEIFRTGDYPQGKFTEEDIDKIVNNYNTSYFEAPVTLDHAQDGAAKGWVKQIWRVGQSLFANLRAIPSDLKNALNEGAWRNRSIELYPDLDGKGLYLKALSFLGVKPPQVKGMAPLPIFKDCHGTVYSFVEHKDKSDDKSDKTKSFNQSNLNNKARSDNDVDEKKVQEMIDSALKEQATKFAEEKKTLTTEFSDKFKKLEDDAKVKETKFSEAEKKARDTEIHAFCEALKVKGKFLPAWQEGDKNIETFMQTLNDEQLKAFKEQMEKFPELIKFKEMTKTPKKGDEVLSFEVVGDNAKLPLRNEALAFQAEALAKEKNIPYRLALSQLSKTEMK